VPISPANAARKHDTAHGTQPGDPAKAAKAIIAAVESDEPPALLLLGNDALKTYRRLAAASLDTVEVGSTSPQAPTSTPELNTEAPLESVWRAGS
jgi:hypothetical protein